MSLFGHYIYENMNLRSLYEELVRKYSADLYRLAYRLCGDRDAAEDLVQETFCEAWRSLSGLRNQLAAKAWLLQILRYQYSHWIRTRKRHPSKLVNPDELEGIAGEIHLDLEMLNKDEPLQKALDALDPEFKGIFLLVFLEGWSCREVAQRLDIPLGTVLSRIHRTRVFLREFIKRYDSLQPDDLGWIEKGSL